MITATTTRHHIATSGAQLGKVGIPGIRITFSNAVEDGKESLPEFVTLEFTGEEGETTRVHVQPEVLERAAELMKELRREMRDWRQLCGEHGYFEGSCLDRCPSCKVAEEPEKTAAPEPEPLPVGQEPAAIAMPPF